MMRLLFGLCLGLVLAAAPPEPASAQFERRETRAASPGTVPPAAKLADLAWLVGEWAGEGISGPATETYSSPIGGQMIGHFVQTKHGKVHFSEILSIAEVNGSLEYRLKHFNGDLTAWEEKEKVIRFPLVAVESGAWFFDGLTIRNDGPGGMVGAVMVNLPEGPKEFVFRYKRVR